jgi:hypothetical protein
LFLINTTLNKFKQLFLPDSKHLYLKKLLLNTQPKKSLFQPQILEKLSMFAEKLFKLYKTNILIPIPHNSLKSKYLMFKKPIILSMINPIINASLNYPLFINYLFLQSLLKSKWEPLTLKMPFLLTPTPEPNLCTPILEIQIFLLKLN